MNGAGCSRPKDVVGSAGDYLCRLVLRGTDILQSNREHPGAFEDVVATVSRSLHLNQQSLPSSTACWLMIWACWNCLLLRDVTCGSNAVPIPYVYIVRPEPIGAWDTLFLPKSPLGIPRLSLTS